MIINRVWSMPNSKTFQIKPIKELIEKYWNKNLLSCDPFANSNILATVTNDLDTQYNTTFHIDALRFLELQLTNCFDFVFYDPPYSPRQVSEVYTRFNISVNKETTQASYWSNQKKEIGRIIKPGGFCLSCCWNSGGIGKKYGFEIIEILIVPHGGWHNDTICVVEKKI